MALTRVPSYDAMACPFPLRRHQREALAALERARAAGSTRWWVTMPPGAGKTLVGTEVARLLNRRTVVLSPNTAIQGQWIRAWELYDGPRAGSRRELGTAFTSLTYQSLAVFDDEDSAPGGSHLSRLHANGRALVETMRSVGPLTIVLDECHHLLEVWGELLGEVLAELPDAVVLGLTATPPESLTRSQRELTDRLFGPVLYEARIPALVREGTLAPYAELAWLVEPTADEADWLAEQSTRFAELTSGLFDPSFGSTPLPQWLTARFVDPVARGTSTWAELSAREPALCDAALRLVHVGLLERPEDALLHEQHRRAPQAEDWRLVIDDWLLSCIAPRSAGEGLEAAGDRTVLETVRRTLPAIGYVWTSRGIRAGGGTVDRVTARSAAKQDAVAGILSAEARNLGERTRALVLCDHERATATTRHRVADGEEPPPQPAGSAVGVLATLLRDPATADLSPLLVTGRTVAGAEETLLRLVAFVDRTHPGRAASLEVSREGEVPTLVGRWTPGQWVAHATQFLTTGGTRALVGTRGLLGEGWDAPCVTTLVDLTTATTPTAVVQTRGRALRVDPADTAKVALIWSVVCVHAGHVAGANDWDRFARKHEGYYTVDEHGDIVDGVAGLHSAFSRFGPPPTTDFGVLDAQMLVRAEDRAGIGERWRSGTAYDDRVEHVARVRPTLDRSPAPDAPGPVAAPAPAAAPVPWTAARRDHPQGWVAVVPLVLLAVLGVLVLLGVGWGWLVPGALVAVTAALAWWGRSSIVAASRRRVSVGLVAAAVADGLQRASLSPVGAEAVRAEVTPDGVETFTLPGADEPTTARFARSLEEAVSPMAAPRYVVSRAVTPPPQGWSGLVRGLRWATGPRPEQEAWHTVPAELGRTRETADAYAAAWAHWVGGGRTLYTGSPDGAGVLATHRGQDPFDVTCVLRRVWH